jgi:UDP-glucose 4-epimerase
MKQRVVIFGAAGFVGASIIKQLGAAYDVLALSRKECDIADATSRAKIAALVKDGDVVICAAAKAPAKNMEMLTDNISMITNIAEGLRGKKLAYLLNISSDAVYGDSMQPMDEASAIEPLSAHGIMHCMREYILQHAVAAPIGHLRPTLIYGAGDPHNGYGPNSFIRLAQAGKNIELFGNGEEQRDHVFVGDVARLAVAMIEQKTIGAVNAVSGEVISFMEIAQLVAATTNGATQILTKPRSGPMPHNGYRAFTNARARAVCPSLTFQSLRHYIPSATKAAA